MLITIQVEESSGFIRVELSGPNDFQSFFDKLNESLVIGRENNISKYFVTDTRDSCFSISETFRIIIEIVNAVKANQVEWPKIAYVNTNIDNDEIAKFAETVSQNRGLIFKFFAESESAISWLGGQSQK